MAILNKTEMLIVHAAKRPTPFLARVYDELTDFYEKFKIQTNIDYLPTLRYLYFENNHKGKTFANIATEVLHIGLSTLEKDRKKFQNMFMYIHDKLKAEYGESEQTPAA